MEVFWTGLASLIRHEYKLTSTTSVWMFFIYGSAVFLEPVIGVMSGLNIVARGLVYMLCIFSAEYIFGSALAAGGICPWDYSHSPYSINGIIRLDYAPVWFFVGLTFEYVYKITAR